MEITSEYLRSYRFKGEPIFDYIIAFLAMKYLGRLTNLQSFFLMLPVIAVMHRVLGSDTELTRLTFNNHLIFAVMIMLVVLAWAA